MGDETRDGDMVRVIRDLMNRCVKAETSLAIESARARYWSNAARKALKAKTLEKAREILEAQMSEDMGLICAMPDR